MTTGARRRRTALGPILILGTLGSVSACRDDCGPGMVSCIPRYAVTVAVTALGTGGPVADATIDVSGALVTRIPCPAEGAATVCRVIGDPGTYVLEITAPGFQSERRTVIVGGAIGECGCAIVVTQYLQVVMDPRT